MHSHHRRTVLSIATLVALFATGILLAQDPPADPPATSPDQPAPSDAPADPSLPKITFFYFDAGSVEWIVSAEPQRFDRHLSSNPVSQGLYNAVTSAVNDSPSADAAAKQMTAWITSERERFEQTRREAPRLGMAEGVIAYLRSNDFSIPRLVQDLKTRSGAREVELVVVHLRDPQGSPSYKLKVVLVDPQIEINKQGFNVDLQAPNANYTVVSYALGVALYNVQEINHSEAPKDESQQPPSVEPLPVPEREPPAPPRVNPPVPAPDPVP
jgi:hypothetical protein